MSKQIDYDILIEHLTKMMESRQIDRLPKSGYAKAIEDVAGCPTVEPKRGKWKEWRNHWAWLVCDQCNAKMLVRKSNHGYIQQFPHNYCPHCGAKMDGDTNG